MRNRTVKKTARLRGRSRGISLLLIVGAFSLSAPLHASEQLMEKSGCISCHRVDAPLIGPSFKSVAARYRDTEGVPEYLFEKVREGGEGVWGDKPMLPNSPQKISDDNLRVVIAWILSL